MCLDPVTMASLALVGGGNFLQQRSNNASEKAMANARNNRLAIGQQDLAKRQEEAGQQFDQTLAGFQQPQQEQDIGALVTKRTQAYDEALTPATGMDPSSAISTAPKIVKDDLAKKMSDAVAFGKQQGGARARIGATGDQFMGNALDLNESGTRLNTINNFARREVEINRARAEEDANNARKAPSGIGQIMSTAGALLGLPGVSSAANNAIVTAGMSPAEVAFMKQAQTSAGVSPAATPATWGDVGSIFGV